MPARTNDTYWCTTKSQFIELSTIWTIDQARFHLNKLRYLESSVFCSKNRDQKWRLCFRRDPFNNHPLHLGVCLIVQSERPIYAEFSISILGSDGRKMLTKKSVAREFANNVENGFRDYILLTDLLENNELLPDDKLTLFCEVRAHIETQNYNGTGSGNRPVCFTMPSCDLEKRLGSLLHDEKYTDVIIVVGEQKIKAHKNILAVRSAVFAAMFDSDMEESAQNHVTITDLDYEVVEQMLRYMYTGEAPRLKSMADHLLVAADKYSLDSLRVMCEQALCANLSVDTAVELLALADLYNADQLKEHTARFIDNNIAEVRKTAAWKNMIAQHSVCLYPPPARLPMMTWMGQAVRLMFTKLAYTVARELINF
ncbi:protein roadkill-like [Ochlerotatus camptorhynchus]|uniref:protein roadkill-like n=1 Tax=Ochlerotatus camptorhynchus TaxID=644619 RepID=UPI0031E0F5E2